MSKVLFVANMGLVALFAFSLNYLQPLVLELNYWIIHLIFIAFGCLNYFEGRVHESR